MIAKAIKGAGFRGAIEYDLRESKGYVLDSNMAGTTPRQLAAEFGEIRKLRPNLKKAVLHVSLAAAIGEQLPDQTWRTIGNRYIKDMGLENSQYIITRHTDTEHEHIHILANRIAMDGSVVSDSHDYKRQSALMREIEKEFSLRVVDLAKPAIRCPTKDELEMGQRHKNEGLQETGHVPRQHVQGAIILALRWRPTTQQFVERVMAQGISVVPNIASTGRMNGFSFQYGEVAFKASDLGAAFKWNNLSKEMDYEQSRDAGFLVRIKENSPRTQPDRERGAIGEESASVDRDGGQANGGQPRNDGGRQENSFPASRGTTNSSGGDAPRLHQGHEYDSALGGNDQQRTGCVDQSDDRVGGAGQVHEDDGRMGMVRPLHDHHFGGSADWNGHLPVSALIQPKWNESPPILDRTAVAVARQLVAFGTAQFEISIAHASTGEVKKREWSQGTIESSLAWLKCENAHGADIYIRPAGEHGLVLVDGLEVEALAKMAQDGLMPAAILETSPDQYQAWVKLSDEPLSVETRAEVALGLAERYGGDIEGASSQSYGRLAGFTNRDFEGQGEDAPPPFVLVHHCSGEVSPVAEDLLERMEQTQKKAPLREDVIDLGLEM